MDTTMQGFVIHHLVRESDLNHHLTLFAGQGASWMVEAGYVSVSGLLKSPYIVCLKIHGMTFKRPTPAGTLLKVEGKVVLTGKSSLTSYILATDAMTGEFVVDGYMTFINTTEDGKVLPHGLNVVAETPEEKEAQEKARQLVAVR